MYSIFDCWESSCQRWSHQNQIAFVSFHRKQLPVQFYNRIPYCYCGFNRIDDETEKIKSELAKMDINNQLGIPTVRGDN
jgi:hypothetical protein